MRRLLILAALLGACLAVSSRAGESFTGSLSTEDFHRAGLDKLSPQERAALDALVKQRAAGDLAQAQAEQPARAAADSPRASTPDHVVVVKPGTRVVEEAIESRIQGKFTGWEGRTVFHLENGQTWEVANADMNYWCPAVMNPKVRITRSSLGGYWMVVEDVRLRVRVKLLP